MTRYFLARKKLYDNGGEKPSLRFKSEIPGLAARAAVEEARPRVPDGSAISRPSSCLHLAWRRSEARLQGAAAAETKIIDTVAARGAASLLKMMIRVFSEI